MYAVYIREDWTTSVYIHMWIYLLLVVYCSGARWVQWGVGTDGQAGKIDREWVSGSGGKREKKKGDLWSPGDLDFSSYFYSFIHIDTRVDRKENDTFIQKPHPEAQERAGCLKTTVSFFVFHFTFFLFLVLFSLESHRHRHSCHDMESIAYPTGQSTYPRAPWSMPFLFSFPFSL